MDRIMHLMLRASSDFIVDHSRDWRFPGDYVIWITDGDASARKVEGVVDLLICIYELHIHSCANLLPSS
jgi:hypothetical protein